MRDDMKDVLLGRGRSSRSGRAGHKPRCIEDSPDRERIGLPPGEYRKERQRDHLRPLIRLIEKRVGKSWDKTWAEICAKADSRSLRGLHLRRHVNLLVATGEEPMAAWMARVGWQRLRPFYVDERGLLRQRRRPRACG